MLAQIMKYFLVELTILCLFRVVLEDLLVPDMIQPTHLILMNLTQEPKTSKDLINWDFLEGGTIHLIISVDDVKNNPYYELILISINYP